jgi:hypothetical protein
VYTQESLGLAGVDRRLAVWPVLRTLVGRTVRAVWEDAFPQLASRTPGSRVTDMPELHTRLLADVIAIVPRIHWFSPAGTPCGRTAS